jgi:hypothetical protein
MGCDAPPRDILRPVSSIAARGLRSQVEKPVPAPLSSVRRALVEGSALSSSQLTPAARTRRRFLQASFASLALSPLASRAFAAEANMAAAALAAARAGLARSGSRVAHTDVVGVADFAQPSRIPRFHLVDIVAGKVETLLVAHGRGSDPGHTGWLQSFSNLPGSEATSQGDYATGAYYVGEHGRSMRLHGLDASNSNAEERAIVIHSAWYAEPNMVRDHGRLGCSEGCFAVSASDLPKVLSRLGPGRLLVATKLQAS